MPTHVLSSQSLAPSQTERYFSDRWDFSGLLKTHSASFIVSEAVLNPKSLVGIVLASGGN